MPSESPSRVLVTGTSALDAAQADAVLEGAVVARAESAVLDLTGPSVAQCIQGLFTNDIEAAGSAAFMYGATLTPKGMIVSDLWVARRGGDAAVYVPLVGRDDVLATFARYVPPRLARVTDRTEEASVLRLVGPRAVELAAGAGLTVPDPGNAGAASLAGAELEIAAPLDARPFALQLTCPESETDAVVAALAATRMIEGGPGALELARVVAGWPQLGAEIGERTLPQEVRFDEHGAVAYEKGCYTGQETVARLHFRGHANWRLAGLSWEGEPDFTVAEVILDQKPVGRVSSAVWMERLGHYVGLAMVRYEVGADLGVTAAGAQARTVSLPFQIP
jgi:folate-binding protein YgfZ